MSNEVTTTQRASLVQKFAARYSLEPEKLLGTLRATAFRVKDGEATNEQMAALLVVADQYGLNPFTKEIFAFPDKGGIVPVVGVDGWTRIINQHPSFDGMEFEQDDESCTCIIYRKDRTHPIKVTEYMAECRRSTGPWQSHPRRMLRHKALIQCARIAFSFAGIYDEDEAERIIERDITPAPAKPAIAMPRSKKAEPVIIESAAPVVLQSDAGSPPAKDDDGGPADPPAEQSPPIKPSQVNILRAKMKAASLTDLDLLTAFPGRCLEPGAGEQFTTAEFNAVAEWIAGRAA